MARRGDNTTSEYLTFDPGGISTISWSKLDQEPESNKASRGEKFSTTVL